MLGMLHIYDIANASHTKSEVHIDLADKRPGRRDCGLCGLFV